MMFTRPLFRWRLLRHLLFWALGHGVELRVFIQCPQFWLSLRNGLYVYRDCTSFCITIDFKRGLATGGSPPDASRGGRLSSYWSILPSQLGTSFGFRCT